MAGSVYELAILLSLKDAASGKLDRAGDRLRAYGKDAKGTLQTFQDLRKNLGQQLVVGGVGVGMLATLGKGVTAAGNYESTLLDLKSAYQEAEAAGGKSAADQAAQLNRLDQLATRLGNNLQGTTGDYVGILSSLKKAGVDAETVLSGAGVAAANLANVTGAVTRGTANEQAKELGQFGKLFKLEAGDFAKSVDLFSALKDRFDIDSNEIIESAKYFQNTANSLKLTGFGGAAETSKFFALLKRTGAMEGSQAGTSATSFFQQFIAKADQRAKIKQKTGLDIKLFDKKGEFLGLENAFKEMEKFRKFSSEKRLELLNEMFGEQGGKAAGVMVEAGAEGWRQITAESSKAVPVNEKINQQMATYNAKLEAVMGTVENLKAITFTPMLNTVKPLLDGLNTGLGVLQGFAKENPNIASVGTHIIGVAGAALVLKGGIGAMLTAWRLWRLTSAVSRGDNLIQYLGGVKAGATAAGDSLTLAGNKAGGLGQKVKGASGIIAVGVAFAGVPLALEGLLKQLNERGEIEVKIKEAGQAATRQYDEDLRAGKLYKGDRATEAEGHQILSQLNTENRLTLSLIRDEAGFPSPGRSGDLFEPRPFGRWYNPADSFNVKSASEKFNDLAPSLHDPRRMATVLELVRAGGLTTKNAAGETLKVSDEGIKKFEQALARFDPTSYQIAVDELSKNTGDASKQLIQNFVDLSLPTQQAAQNFKDLLPPVNRLPFQFGQVGYAATSLANRLAGIDIELPTFSGGTFAVPNVINNTGPTGTTFSDRFNGGRVGTATPAPRAHGGPVFAGKPYVVGDRADRRPELFMPRVGGQVLTEGQVGASLMTLFQRQRAEARRDSTVVRPASLTLVRAPRVEVMTAAKSERPSFFAPERQRAALGDRRPSMLTHRAEGSVVSVSLQPRRETSRAAAATLVRPTERQRAESPTQAPINIMAPTPGRSAGTARVERASATPLTQFNLVTAPAARVARRPSMLLPRAEVRVVHASLQPRSENSRAAGATLARPAGRLRAEASPQARVNITAPVHGRAAGVAPRVEGGRTGVTINGGLHVHVPPGSNAAENPEAFAEFVLQYVTHEVGIQRKRS